MSDSEGVFAAQYLKDCSERVAGIEADLLAIEKGGAAIDDDMASRLCQAVRAIDGGAGIFHFAAIREVAQKMEEAVTRICCREMAPTAARVSVLLRATDALSALIGNPGPGNPAEQTEILAALAGVCVDPGAGEARAVQLAGGPCECFWRKTISPAGCCCRPFFRAMANVTLRCTAGRPWKRFVWLCSRSGTTT
jgi:two-component system chemotaxis sensor kinase CheA